MSASAGTWSAVSIAADVRAGARSAESVVREALERAEGTRASGLNAFLELLPDEAIARARAVDAAVRAGGPDAAGPLAGVPVALKDNICLDHGRTTCASRMLAEYRSPFSATCAERLTAAGAVVIGKTNLDEFAMGSSTENSAFGPTRNPHDPSRVPGGSSGGSAAAVAAGAVPVALGSDTGGSIRQPAGFCGVVGLKPTYGRVSRYGLVAYASSLDQIGPLCGSVADAAAMLDVISGFDPRDSTSADAPATLVLPMLETPVEGLRLGVPAQVRGGANDPAAAAVFERAVERFRSLGATIVECDLPTLSYGIAAYYLVAAAEASSNLARFDGVRYGRRATRGPGPGEDLMDLYCRSRSEGLGAEVQRRIMLGTYALSSGYYDAYYTTALKARRVIKREYDSVLSGPASPRGGLGCHAVLMPAAPGPAFKIGEKTSDPLAMYLEDLYTVTVNLAGLPAITVPAGTVRAEGKDLPVGVQLIGAAMDEGTLLRAARMFEKTSV